MLNTPTHRLPSVPMHSDRPSPPASPAGRVLVQATRSSGLSQLAAEQSNWPLALLSTTAAVSAELIVPLLSPSVEVSANELPLRSMKPSASTFMTIGRLPSKCRLAM